MSKHLRIIKPNQNIRLSSYLQMMWDYRYFSKALAEGEIKNKYAKTFFGVFLSLIQTLLGIAVYWLIFGLAIKIDTGSVPYPIFALPGIIIWQYFSYLIGNSSGVLINSEHLINKMYFPRINLVFAKVLPGLIDFFVGFVVLIILFFVFNQNFSILWIYLPIIALITIITGLSIGLWVSIMSLYIRDISQIIIQITNFLIFITPVFYPGTIVPDNFRFILYINPVAGIIEFSRAILFNTKMPEYEYLIGFGLVVILFISGLLYFKKIEKQITDIL